MMAKGPANAIVSGNTRVKVTLYGFVNRAVRFASSGDESEFHSVDNNESPSRLGIRAVGSLNKNTSAVALAEFGMSAGGGRHGTGFSSAEAQESGGTVGIRHSVIDLSNKDLGTLSLGHSVMAHVSAAFTGFQGANIATGFGVLDTPAAETAGVTGGRVGNPGNVNPGRENRVMYSTPNIMGFGFSASLNQAEGWSLGMSFSSPESMSKDISIKVGAGYRAQPADAGDVSTYGISGGVQHNPSGLSLNGVYVRSDKDAGMTAAKPEGKPEDKVIDGEDSKVASAAVAAMASPGFEHTAWAVDLSWTGKLIDAGSTSLSVGFANYEKGKETTQQYFGAVNQQVDSAAADLYLGVSHDAGEGADADGDPADRESVMVIIAGARVKF